jgi:hypothetical protein
MLCMHGFSWLPAGDLFSEKGKVMKGSGAAEVCVCVWCRPEIAKSGLPKEPLAGKNELMPAIASMI